MLGANSSENTIDLRRKTIRVMETVVLGSTGIKVNKNGFGALPIQRVSTEDAVKLARKAYEAGITFLIRRGFTRTVRKN